MIVVNADDSRSTTRRRCDAVAVAGLPDRGIAVAVDQAVRARSDLGHNAFRWCTHRGGDGGAGWLDSPRVAGKPS